MSRTKIMILVVALALVVGGALGYSQRSTNKTVPVGSLPEYFNFGNNYVFSIPGSYIVDSQSVLGAELVYSTPISAKTVEDVYSQNGMAIQAVDLSDHSAQAFKDYVNNKYVPQLKQSLSTEDIAVKFGKTNGNDNARITVKKDGGQIRFIYLRNGQHPTSLIAKSETDNFKVIEQTIKDVESSDLKNEAGTIKQTLQNSLQLAKSQKDQDLYNSGSPELRAQTTLPQLTAALNAAGTYLSQNITVSGGSYKSPEFSAALRFTPPGQNNAQPAIGAITLKKSDNQWKVEALSLPAPKQ